MATWPLESCSVGMPATATAALKPTRKVTVEPGPKVPDGAVTDETTGASSVPRIETVIALLALPSADVTTSVSVRLVPETSACTAASPLSAA